VSAEELSHAEKVRRGMELSRAHKAGEHTEPNPDCAKCKAEAKQAHKQVKEPVPDVKPEVTLEGVPSMTVEPTVTISGEATLTTPHVSAETEVAVPGVIEREERTLVYPPDPTKSEREKEQEHQAAIKAAQEVERMSRMTVAPIVAKPGEISGDKDYDILVHILEDGFTVLGTVWYRGQEIGIKKGSAADELSTDKNGHHWYDRDPADQMEYYGKQMFGLGPWPFQKAAPNDEQDYMSALASGDADAVRKAPSLHPSRS
jgi:hypothetical protein